MLAASTFYPPIEQYTIAVMDLHLTAAEAAMIVSAAER